MKSQPISILLADDDNDDSFLFKDALKELHFDVTLNMVPDGAKLMNVLNHEHCVIPSILFLDLNMPVKNGFECLDEIKQNVKLQSLPVIIFSTSFDVKVVKNLYEKGAWYYLRKPDKFEDLKLFIHKALSLLLDAEKETRNEKNFIITS